MVERVRLEAFASPDPARLVASARLRSPSAVVPVALPPETAFLAGLLPPGALLDALARAARQGVSPDALILAEGLVGEEAFYRALALHHGLAFLDGPIPLDPAAPLVALEAGMAALLPGAVGADYVFAPQGPAIAALGGALMRPGSIRRRATIAAPSRFAAAVRSLHGEAIADSAAHALAEVRPDLSAKTGLSSGQRRACLAAVALLALASLPASIFGQVAALALALLFLAAAVVRISACIEADGPAPPIRPLSDVELPVYTVLVPLYREARIVRDLVAALDALDYPSAKLDIKLLVEAEDCETLAALQALSLPTRYEILVAPEGQPRTKPRALNIGLAFARGSLVTVYDAEDRPEPDQLRLAAQRFAAAPRRVACLQARLCIDNSGDSWLVRLFGLEYAALFDVLNPGFARMRLPIPLGGTSNHFRKSALVEAGGWDAWNVTEDADLGLRLARFGHDVEALASTTYEEAPITLRAWTGQRSRWLKGWMQTLVVHTRQPARVLAELGPLPALAAFVTIAGAVGSALLGPLFLLLLARAVWTGALFTPSTLLEAAVSGATLTLAASGLVGMVLPVLQGARRRGWRAFAAFLLPLYYVLPTFAAWRALLELRANPFGWTKTEHGLARRREDRAEI